MKRICLLIALLVFTFGDIFAQNKSDNKGRRQGEWIEYHDNGKVRMRGSFKDGFPVGDFYFYDEYGDLKAKKVFSNNGADAETSVYSSQGRVIAKGLYHNKIRTGEWHYFDENSEKLILVETYENGVLEGYSCSYYDSGVPQFEGEYKNGVKFGEWKTYDPEGNLISVDKYGLSDQ